MIIIELKTPYQFKKTKQINERLQLLLSRVFFFFYLQKGVVLKSREGNGIKKIGVLKKIKVVL